MVHHYPFAPARPLSPRRWAARSCALLLLVAIWLLPAAAAMAHTGLESSDPAEGAMLDTPFGSVELTFTKPIELLPKTVVLTDATGSAASRTVEVARSEDGLVVTATFGEPLYGGEWQVHWRVLASDSHPREGIVTVTVADTVLAPPPPAQPTPAPSPDGTALDGTAPDAQPEPAARPTDAPASNNGAAAVSGVGDGRSFPSAAAFEIAGDVMRSVYYLGLMVAMGLALFKAGPHRGEAANAVGLARAVAVGAAIGLVGGILEVVAHAGALADAGLGGIFDGATWSALSRTGLRNSLVLRVLGLSALLVGGVRRARRDVASGPDVVKLIGVVLVLASFQYVGHTSSIAPAWIIHTADLLHVLAAAVWVGGLVGLAMLAGHSDRMGRARTAARFSTAASVAVAAVAVAGTVMAYLTLPDLGALFSTGYGRLLLAKLALVGILGALGAHNHFRVIPRLTDGDTDALDDLRRTVGLEVVVVLVVIVLTALLVNSTPF